MMLIEFLNEHPLENIASSLILHPDQVIFIGTDEAALKHWKLVYDKTMDSLGMKTESSVELVSFENIDESLDRFQELYDKIESDDIWFDVLGGKEDALIGFGRFMESNPQVKNWHLVEPDMKHRVMKDAVTGEIIKTENGKKSKLIGIGDFMPLYDTSWIEKESTESQVYGNKDDRDFIEDLWYISRDMRTGRSPVSWNQCFSYNKKFIIDNDIWKNRKIRENKFLQDYDQIYNEVMEKSGNLFEMYTAAEVCTILQSDRQPRVWQSVTLDWDGKRTSSKKDVYNEVDVMSFYGYCPVFISCKAGPLDEEEIFKLNSVAHHFGGKYVITGIVKADKIESEERKERITEMGMFYIDNVNRLSLGDFRSRLRSNVCGNED